MVNIDCAVDGCDHTFTSGKQGVKSHFAFSHSLPEKRQELKETKQKIEEANESVSKSSNKYPDDWDKIRRQVFMRDNYRCQECGVHGDNAELHAHHQTPISEGGGHDINNLITLCQRCHNKKHDHSVGFSENNSKNKFQKNGDDIFVRCGLCDNQAILQRNPGRNYVICENCGEYEVPGSE